MVTPRREASPTVGFINYCQAYQNLFSDVRNYEAFKLLHLGMLSEIPRKSLPKIARAVGLEDSQGLNYFCFSKCLCSSRKNHIPSTI